MKYVKYQRKKKQNQKQKEKNQKIVVRLSK